MKTLAYNLIRAYRLKQISKLLDGESESILDIGCHDLYFSSNLRQKGYKYIPVDLYAKDKGIFCQNVENLGFKDKSFDIVLCLEVLEHTKNPVKAIDELKRVAKKQLIITVPNEPFFSALRFFTWSKDHLWAITPAILKLYLGKPVFEKKIFFMRYYLGVWKLQFNGEK